MDEYSHSLAAQNPNGFCWLALNCTSMSKEVMTWVVSNKHDHANFLQEINKGIEAHKKKLKPLRFKG